MGNFVTLSAEELVYLVKNTVWGGSNATSGYIWGAMGETVTESHLQEWARRVGGAESPQGKMMYNVGRKWLGKRAWDCSGIRRWLTKYHMTPYQGGGATTIFSRAMFATGPISTMPDTPGIWVFRGEKSDGVCSNTKMAHIGLYIGDGMVIHARGTAYGVICEPMNSHTWSHWGADERVKYPVPIQNAPHPSTQTDKPIEAEAIFSGRVTTTGGDLNIRKGPGKNYARIGALHNGATVKVLGTEETDGWYHIQTEDEKMAGFVAKDFLVKIPTT